MDDATRVVFAAAAATAALANAVAAAKVFATKASAATVVCKRKVSAANATAVAIAKFAAAVAAVAAAVTAASANAAVAPVYSSRLDHTHTYAIFLIQKYTQAHIPPHRHTKKHAYHTHTHTPCAREAHTIHLHQFECMHQLQRRLEQQ